ncbi:MAG: PaaI family thioesterase [Bacteroidetes bacterium]|nr:PaaI family thioesterase [Bacteroidota bacterium]MBV6460062.1 hypothetical protein [Flavobacteriales bacterium]WKZ73936.1 MAG: PaaI family thioesterase [Vicingaceae bacterium]MCL4816412.1 PaaI family thioesterase [Flavobacteriales bacterium]NOG95487.1 PaaI family thioesterase [Bacteroidota bacterium]
MDWESHFKKLEAMYLSANINDWYKPTILIRKKFSEISIKVNPSFFHAANALHGSVYFKLLDDAAFFAANSVVHDVFVLTTQFNIHLLRPVNSGVITSKGSLLFSSLNMLTAKAELFDEKKRLLAHGSGQFAKSKILLSSIENYKN